MTLIRKAGWADLPFIISLSRDSFSQYGPYDLSMARWFLTPGTHTFIAERGNKGKIRCGFIMVAVMASRFRTRASEDADPGGQREDGEEAVLEIIAIAVSKEYQRQRIGTELINFIRQFNKDLAAGSEPLKIRLSVAETNKPGRSFFERCGFRVIAEAPWRYPAGQKALRMELSVGVGIEI